MILLHSLHIEGAKEKTPGFPSVFSLVSRLKPRSGVLSSRFYLHRGA